MVSRSHFEELVIRHRNSAFHLAYRILQNQEDTEDAAQDAYVRAFRAFDTIAGAGAGWSPPTLMIRAFRAHCQELNKTITDDQFQRAFRGNVKYQLDALRRGQQGQRWPSRSR